MNKIYSDMGSFERAAEEEFIAKCEEIAYYQGNKERVTLDGEWTESELRDDVYDEVSKLLLGEKGLAEKYKYRALVDKNILIPEYMCNHICEGKDLIEWYNTIVDKNRNNEKKLFGIVYFDTEVIKEAERVLKRNLVS